MRHFISSAIVLLAMPLTLAACKPMVVLAEPVTVRQQVSVENRGCIVAGGEVLASMKAVEGHKIAAAALAGRTIDFSTSRVLVVYLGEHLTSGTSARIDSIGRKGGTLSVWTSIMVPEGAKEEKPIRLCVVAVIEKDALAVADRNGVHTNVLDPTEVVVNVK